LSNAQNKDNHNQAKKKIYTNKTTKEPMHSQAKIKKEQNSKHETKKKA